MPFDVDGQAAEGQELVAGGHELRLATAGRNAQDSAHGRGAGAGEDAHEALVHHLGHVERPVGREPEADDVGEAGGVLGGLLAGDRRARRTRRRPGRGRR